MQSLPTPGFQEMATALQAFLTLKQSGGATELFQRVRKSQALQFTWLKKWRQTRHQGTVLKKQLIGEQPWQIKTVKPIAGIVTTADRLEAPLTQIRFLQFRQRRPEMTVVRNREILQLTLPEFLANDWSSRGQWR